MLLAHAESLWSQTEVVFPSAPPRAYGGDMTTTPDNKAVIERYVAALLAGDETAIRASFAPDATWSLGGELPISGTWRGRDTIVDEFLGGALSYFDPDSVAIEITSLLSEGEDVVLEWTSRARTLSGADYENRCIGVFTVRDGEIHAVREYMDTLHASKVAFVSESAAA